MLRIVSFDDGAHTFNALASGIYVESGPNDGPEVVRGRIRRLAGGGKVSADGTGPLPTTPPAVAWEIISVAANPDGHAQIKNLQTLKGAYGTLTARISGASSHTSYTCPAYLVDTPSTWRAPYRQGQQSVVAMRIEFEMMDFWTLVV